ncbi:MULTISPECIES: NifU N-terminal domain-containing protein [Pontibacillus]|uniref:NifU N-terminal domain-containing protein n=1 Tax=Pontibacillus chungwhensis TaxID=265426 RepID=A0ABY8UZQ2_9BACI|nr:MULTISPECIES: NifU N-terminal domain-containing protein [Pontibacillus]MCD5324715.1 NifU N-terminal domain-containing protein [Pontibacillus sp. HN14]WIF98992.1 NifU N-terminal domain-containing protein [Pontibacillus chungwhensis]
MSVQAKETPNPNAVKFDSDRMIFDGNGSVSVMPGQTSEHAILNDLMALNGVDNVFGFQNFITVNKKNDASWDELKQQVIDTIEGHGF